MRAECLSDWLRATGKGSVNSGELPTAIVPWPAGTPLRCPACGREPWSLRAFFEGLASCEIGEPNPTGPVRRRLPGPFRNGSPTQWDPDLGEVEMEPPDEEMEDVTFRRTSREPNGSRARVSTPSSRRFRCLDEPSRRPASARIPPFSAPHPLRLCCSCHAWRRRMHSGAGSLTTSQGMGCFLRSRLRCRATRINARSTTHLRPGVLRRTAPMDENRRRLLRSFRMELSTHVVAASDCLADEATPVQELDLHIGVGAHVQALAALAAESGHRSCWVSAMIKKYDISDGGRRPEWAGRRARRTRRRERRKRRRRSPRRRPCTSVGSKG